jgi:site-specific DNA-methyltransferase (adenine-specific)
MIDLRLGDCLEVMKSIPAGSVDAVITDPPYSSGGQFRGDRSMKPSTKYIQTDSVFTERSEFTGDNRDQRAFLVWATMWLSQLLRISKPGAVAMVFTDWRQLPTVTDAVQCGGWVWRNIVTWWKPGIRMQRGRFSSSAEYVVYCSNGVPNPGKESPQNVLSIQPVGGDDKTHMAEKPVDLIKTIIGVTPAGATILDPFMGSGTTGVACVQTGRNFIGIEIDPGYFKIAEKRIHDAQLQMRLEI